VKILCFAGSAREDSFNKKLAKIASGLVEKKGVDVTFIDLKDFPMPIYNGDLEASSGLPENARKFKKLFCEHQGFLIASPEYNSSLAPLLKNALDWASRSEDADELPLVAFQGKVVALVSASPGGLGGLRGLVILRMMLGNIGVLVVPSQFSLPQAFSAFGDSGQLKDKKHLKALGKVVDELVDVVSRQVR